VGCLLALGVLGRSFGVVAADRGLRTGGPYRLVRHPVYASYLITEAGYVLQNPSVWNLGLLLIELLCQIGRIHAEERVLRQDPAWSAYAAKTRYRLLPGVFYPLPVTLKPSWPTVTTSPSRRRNAATTGCS
jgi:protein-S-isoprenylcysteine O-methyltransferase Ste14